MQCSVCCSNASVTVNALCFLGLLKYRFLWPTVVFWEYRSDLLKQHFCVECAAVKSIIFSQRNNNHVGNFYFGTDVVLLQFYCYFLYVTFLGFYFLFYFRNVCLASVIAQSVLTCFTCVSLCPLRLCTEPPVFSAFDVHLLHLPRVLCSCLPCAACVLAWFLSCGLCHAPFGFVILCLAWHPGFAFFTAYWTKL